MKPLGRDAGPLIVGASLAGVCAAESARRAGYDGAITLLGGEPHLPYDRPPLSREFLRGERPVNRYFTKQTLRGQLASTRGWHEVPPPDRSAGDLEPRPRVQR
jgi:hypothetical protein